MADPLIPQGHNTWAAALPAAAALTGAETVALVQDGISVQEDIFAVVDAALADGVALNITGYTQTTTELGISAGVLDTVVLNGVQYWCEVDELITTINVTAAAAGLAGSARIYFHYKTAPYAVSVPAVNFPNRVSQAFVTSSGVIYVCDVTTVPGPTFGVLWSTWMIGAAA